MKPTAHLVNVARGGLIDEEALAAALREGRLGGAAIDVFEKEPPTGSVLLDAPNTVLTPHLGASTEEAQAKVAEEVVSQMLDVLAGRSARYVVNAPLVPAETAAALAPFLPLARTLGQFYAQFARSAAGPLTLEVAGDIAERETAPLIAAALAGLLSDSTDERVTTVNAPLLARERGLSLVASKTHDSPRYPSLLTLRGPGVGADATAVAGTVAGADQRLVKLNDYWIDTTPAPWMLITHHKDLPGTMGRIGTMLGEADVNISAMHLGRDAPRGDAVMVLALDDAVPEDLAQRIREQEAVLELWLIRLNT
jgi:D-3-phosphoglycerate dehydrogenase